MRSVIIHLIVLLSMACCIVSCEKSTQHVATEPIYKEEEGVVMLSPLQVKSVGIQLGKIERKNLNSTLLVNGVLDVPPQNMVTISAMMGGFIKSTALLQGLKVSKGQIIATIQNPDFIKIQSNYLENKSKLSYLEQEYKRQEELSHENVSARKIFQQVTSEYNSIQASVAALGEQLKILNINAGTLNNTNIRSTVNIYSPINGHVTEVNVNIGKFVNPQDVICEIVDTDHLHAELTVFEKDISKVKKGQKVKFILVNESGKERLASVYLINRQISTDRTIRVHAHLEKEDFNLMPNMYLKAFIEIGDSSKSTALPEQAVVNDGEKYYIFVKDNESRSAIVHRSNNDLETEHNDTEGHSDSHASAKRDHYVYRAIQVQKGVTQNGYSEVILPNDFNVALAEVVVKGAYDLLSKMNNAEEEEGHMH